MKMKIKLRPPKYLNYITADAQDTFDKDANIPIWRLSKEQAEEYSEFAKQEFMEHWKRLCQQANPR